MKADITERLDDVLANHPLEATPLEGGSLRIHDIMPRLVPSGLTADYRIAECARVSTGPPRSKGMAQDARLVASLWQRRHTSPFEHVTLTVFAEAPIYVAREWMRHRTQSYSEASARYAAPEWKVYLPQEWRTQPTQMQGTGSPLTGQVADLAFLDNAHTLAIAQQTYENNIQANIERGLARTVMPVSHFTTFMATANLLNWLRFLDLRTHPDAQHEIRVYADALTDLLEPIVPHTIAAFRRHRDRWAAFERWLASGGGETSA